MNSYFQDKGKEGTNDLRRGSENDHSREIQTLQGNTEISAEELDKDEEIAEMYAFMKEMEKHKKRYLNMTFKTLPPAFFLTYFFEKGRILNAN